jgi:WD40 repeat protein
MIQTSVAHLYHSALPFAPKTPLWDVYRARENSVEARILQGRELGWTPLIRTVSLPGRGMAARYSHNGCMLAVGGDDFSQLYLSGTGEQLAELESRCGDVKFISFSCDDRVLATASGSTIRLWDVASCSIITTLVGDSAFAWSVDFHPSIGHLLAAAGEVGRVYVWDIRDSSCTELNVAASAGRLCWVRQREQKCILVGCESGRMEVWDVDARQQVQVFFPPSSSDSIYAVASSDDGSLVASGSRDRMLVVYSTHTGEVLHSHKHSHWIYSVAFSPTAPILAFASGIEVFLWFYATDRIVTFTGHSHYVYSVAFSPNGRFIASASKDSTLRIREADATDPALDDIHHSQRVSSVHFSNDGQLVVSASLERTVKVWDTLTGTLCTTLKEHTNRVLDAIIFPDNVHVVSIDGDDTLIVWDWQKGKSLFTNTVSGRDHGWIRTLHPYTYTLSPLGFISTHFKLDNSKRKERTVCCWSIDLSAPSNPCIVLVAYAVVNTSNSGILRITHRGSPKTSNLTLVLECYSGKQFSALWNGHDVVGNSPAQLQFIEETDESLLKDTNQSLAGSELPCCYSHYGDWILDEHDRQILWVPPTNRVGEARWYGHHLVIGGQTGRLTLVDFSNVILNDAIEF